MFEFTAFSLCTSQLPRPKFDKYLIPKNIIYITKRSQQLPKRL